jgi:hypothetical protein
MENNNEDKHTGGSMSTVPFQGSSEGRENQLVIAQFDAPAYLRRARGVQEALEHLLRKGRAQRDEWLAMTKVSLGRLHALAGDWSAMRPLVADEAQLAVLESLHASLAPKLRAPVPPTSSQRVLRHALHRLVSSLERFNARWQDYLEKVDLGVIDRLRDGYNRYYVLEKSCALRSDRLAGYGFVPLPPLSVEELASHLPTLPVPKVAT